jgi:hypothetical protein
VPQVFPPKMATMGEPMKLYFGGPNELPCVGIDGRTKKRLPRRVDKGGKVMDFAWGDGSPGSARLAFAILKDALGNEVEAARYSMLFKQYPVSSWKVGEDWAISESEVMQRVQRIREVFEDRARIARIVDLEPRPVVFEGGGGVGVSDQDWEKRR